MSQSILSFACAGVLLAVAAHAAETAGADDAAPVPVPAHAKASEAAAANRTVKIFVTMRDDAGKVLAKSSVRIESDDSPDIGVGPDGAKLSLPAAKDSVIKVLFPGGNCSVTLAPKAIASGRVAIGVGRAAGATRCALEDMAQAGKPASAPAATSGHATGSSSNPF